MSGNVNVYAVFAIHVNVEREDDIVTPFEGINGPNFV